MAPVRRRLIRLAAIGSSALLLTGCAIIELEENPLTTFEPAGPFAEEIDSLFWMVFWIATGVFAFVMLALVVMIFLFRERGKPDAKEPKQLHGNPKLEVVWTVIPALILAAVAVPSVRSVFELTECDPHAMEIEVIGHQWWFEYHYPEHDFRTANVMVVPAGEEICAVMTSDDVVHNFWIPALNGKRYVIPGQTTELRLQADQPGEYWGHCAEFCGLSHSLMRARVHAVPRAEFDAWATAQQEPTPLPVEGDPGFEGFQVFQNKGCSQCHQVRFDPEDASILVPPERFNGPELTHFASRNVFAGASLPEQGETREEALARWLADPPAVKPGTYMPDLGLTAQEIDALIVWLESNQ